MTIKELTALIGRKTYIIHHNSGLKFALTIEDVRTVFGRIQCQVTDCTGLTAWVEYKEVTA